MFDTMWSAVQQAIYIAFGPVVLWVLAGALALVALLAAWQLGASLYRKYFG